MPSSLFLPCRRHLLLAAGLTGLLGGCVRHRFFQPDARVGPGSQTALPLAADSVLTTAGRHYNQHGWLHHAIWGRHYRPVWAAPVTVPVLKLAQAVPGGLRASKPGGGFQSISMTLEGPHGRGFALRALDKEPRKTLSKVLRHTFLLNVVRDATSAAIPYGALTVPPLAWAAGVPHTRPRLVYVRQDERGLGAMSEQFQGKVAMLEEKYDALASRTPDLALATAFVGSADMLKNLYASPVYTIDQPAFLRARLLDVWLGDWDRHEGQWQWAAFAENGGRTRYQAIPKDRDQVYSRFDDGLVPWLASRPFAASKFQTFKPEYGFVRGLVKQARFIDARALSALTRRDFRRLAAEFQQRLPDTVIARAMRRLPPAVFALEGPRLEASLRRRREALPQAAETYYRTLARRPVVGGTELAERFVVRRGPDSTTVRVYAQALSRLSPGDSLRFQRTYYAAETQKLVLEGIGGNDVFEVSTANGGRPMALAIFGGPGQDRLLLQGPTRRLQLYDEPRGYTGSSGLRVHLPPKKHQAYNRFARK